MEAVGLLPPATMQTLGASDSCRGSFNKGFTEGAATFERARRMMQAGQVLEYLRLLGLFAGRDQVKRPEEVW